MAYSISWWLDSKYKHEPEEGKSEEKEDTWRPLGSLMDFYTGAANWQNRDLRGWYSSAGKDGTTIQVDRNLSTRIAEVHFEMRGK